MGKRGAPLTEEHRSAISEGVRRSVKHSGANESRREKQRGRRTPYWIIEARTGFPAREQRGDAADHEDLIEQLLAKESCARCGAPLTMTTINEDNRSGTARCTSKRHITKHRHTWRQRRSGAVEVQSSER